jgi:large repetitive protein
VNANFTVSLSNPSKQVITVKYQTANGTATAGSDYTALPLQTLTFNPGGPLTQQVSVSVNGDLLNEADETFFVNLTVPTNATISDSQGQGTIQNDDPLPSLTINDVSQDEGNSGTSLMTFTVTLNTASGQVVTVKYATQDNSATAPSDYVAITPAQTLTLNPGGLTGQIQVTINGDTTVEPDESFFVNLTLPTNATIADNRGVGTILNDDVTTGIEEPGASPAVAETFVGVNYPNPFSGETTIPVGLTAASEVRVRIYDARGRLVRSFDVQKSQGVQHLRWNGVDEGGVRLPSGFYVARIEAEGKIFNQPMKIVR